MRQIPGIAESHLGIRERENQTETLQSSEHWPWLHAQPCGTGQLPETWPSARSSGQWLCVIFPVPINRWHWPCARVCDQPLYLPSPHSLWLSRAWGRSRLCARHLCRRHLKLSSFPAPPPEGISTKFSLGQAKHRLLALVGAGTEQLCCGCLGQGLEHSLSPCRTEPCREGDVLEEQLDSSRHQHVTGPKGQNYFPLIFRENSCFITNQESTRIKSAMNSV